jgi:hypothetical protein
MAEEQAPNFQGMPQSVGTKKYNKLYDTLTSQTVGDRSFADMYSALQEAEVGAYKEKTGWPYIFTGASKKSSAFGPLQITYSTALDYFYPGDSETEKRDNMEAGNFKEGYTQLPSDVKSYIKGFIEQGINKRNRKGGVYGSYGVGDISAEDHKKHYPFLAAVHLNEKKKLADADTVPAFVNAHFGDIQEDDPQKENKERQLANLQTKVSDTLGVTVQPVTRDVAEGFSEPVTVIPEPQSAPVAPETKAQTDEAFTLDYEGELPDIGDEVKLPDLPETDVAPDTTDAIPVTPVEEPEQPGLFDRFMSMFSSEDDPDKIQERELAKQNLLQELETFKAPEMNKGGIATAIQETEDIESGVDSRTKKEMITDQMAGLAATGKTVAENVPGVGEAIVAKEVAEDLSSGDYLSAGIGTAALGMGFLPGGDILNKPVRAFAKKFRKVDEAEANKFLDNPDELQAWRDDPSNQVDKAEKKRRETRKYPEQAKKLESGLMSGPEYRKYIRENQPATKFTLEDLQTMVPTFKDTVGALGKSKASKGIVGLNKKIEKGTIVDSRLDIPAYNNYNTWVASMTLPNKGGNVYGRTAVLKDVDFSISTSTEKVRKIAKDETNKFPMATMKGEWQDLSDEEAFQLAQKYLADPKSGYVQVGFNPERHSFFYDKDTMMPIFEAEEVVQIGALVLAKPKLPKTAAERAARIGKLRELKIENPDRVGRPATFNEGGMAMERQMNMFEDGGLMDEGGMIDEESGNDVPPGSLREEVRDDIPAQLSEGEFVFPADVVRYWGLEKLMEMRQEAKAGLARMEAMGQMGNADEATLPDDIPFDLDDLDMEDEPMEFQQGGLVPNPYGVYQQPSQFATYGQQPYQAPQMPVAPVAPQVPLQTGFTPMTTPVTPTAPTFEELLPTTTGRYDELREYVNSETGESMTIPFVDGKPIYPIPIGFTPKPTEQVEAVVPEVPTATVQKEEGEGPGIELEYTTTDVTGIGYDRSGLSDELRDVIDSYGFGLGTLGEAFGKAGVTGALGEVMNKEKRAPIKQIGSALFGGVVDGFRGGDVDIVNGRVEADYTDVRSFSDMDLAQQDLIAKTVKSVSKDMESIFFNDKKKPKTEKEVSNGLKAAASVLGISLKTDQGFNKSLTQLSREIGRAKQEEARQAELEKQRQEIIKQQEKTIQKQKEEGDGPATTGGDRYGTAGKDVSYGGYSGGSSDSGSFGMGYRAKGGLIEKPKPKAKKMKRGGLASK